METLDTTSDIGVQLIKHYESCRLKAYQDSRGVWTIGWGSTYYLDGTRVKKGDTITQEGADELFAKVLSSFERDVTFLTEKVILKWHQKDALVSFAYNVGSDIDIDHKAEGLGDSTLLRKVLANPDDPSIEHEFMQWVHSGGKLVDGLVSRRKSEWILYHTGTLKFFN